MLYALLGTQVILLFLIGWIGGTVYEANVALTTKIGAALVGVEEKLQDQTSELEAIRRFLEDPSGQAPFLCRLSLGLAHGRAWRVGECYAARSAPPRAPSPTSMIRSTTSSEARRRDPSPSPVAPSI